MAKSKEHKSTGTSGPVAYSKKMREQGRNILHAENQRKSSGGKKRNG